jgi:hypothetical protein
MRVQNSRVTPPGGWQWRASDGQLITATGFDTFMSKVRAWHEANGVPLDVEAFEDALCRSLGIEDTHCAQPPKFRPSAGFPTLGDLKSFLNLLRIRMNTPDEDRVVEQAEAERRASICRTCPMNRRVDGCLGCGGVLKMVREIVGARTTTHDAALETCSVCHCFIRAKIWVSKGILDQVEDGMDREYPEHCWMRDEQDVTSQ